jgi:hypothetical protein
MDSNSIVAAIRRRRNYFFDAQGVGTEHDPLEFTAAEVSRAIADEYDSLLAEIQDAVLDPVSLPRA